MSEPDDMKDRRRSADASARADQRDAEPEAGGLDEGVVEAGATMEDDLRAALDAAEQQKEAIEQKLLRVAADYQNYARRAEMNVNAAREQQSIAFARALVTVLDHFDRALEVDPQKTSAKDLLSGVEMVRDELLRTLQRFDIERLDVQPGEPFDPNRHEAMMRQNSDEHETNQITAQLQPGYVLKDKTIRPAKVAVAE